jgi:hypothetical protein
VADAGAWFGEGLEPIGFDAGCEFRERSLMRARWTEQTTVW